MFPSANPQPPLVLTSADISTSETDDWSTVSTGDREFTELPPALRLGGGGAVGGDIGPAPLATGLTGTQTHIDSPVSSIHLE